MAGGADPIAALAGSRWRLLRAVGLARQSLLEAGTATALPSWLLAAKLLFMQLSVAAYITSVVFGFMSQTPTVDFLLRISFGVVLASSIVSLGVSFLALNKLFSPTRDFHHDELVVRRGCLVDTRHKCGPELEDGRFETRQANPWKCIWRRQRPALMSFEDRTFVYSARLLLKGLILLVSVVTGILQAQLPESRRVVANVAVIATLIMSGFLMGDSALSFLFGLHVTPLYKLGSRLLPWWSTKPKDESFCPVDPRSTALQNLFFLMMLQPPSLALFVQSYAYDTNRGGSIFWALPAAGAMMTIEVVISGAQHMWCPVTYIFGLMVQSGLMVPPHPETSNGLAVYLNYSVQGPVVKLTDGYPYTPKVAWGLDVAPRSPRPDSDSNMTSVMPAEIS